MSRGFTTAEKNTLLDFLKEEEKNSLWQRYFDIEWCDDVTDLCCVHCHRVAINHYVSSCQHLFCMFCREFYNDKQQQWICPQCQAHITHVDGHDVMVEVRIRQLKISCPNKQYGCNYADQLWKIPPHLATCEDKQEAALEIDSLMMGTIDHSNDIICNKVEEKLNQLERKTDDIDSNVTVLTQGLTNVVKKAEGADVVMEMVFEPQTKGFQSIRDILESHCQRIQQMELLLQQTVEVTSLKVEQLRVKTASMAQQLDSLQYEKSEQLSHLPPQICNWTLSDVENFILHDNFRYWSTVTRFIGYKYEVQAKLEKKKGRMVIHIQFKDGVTVNENLNKSAFTKCKYIIRDQTSIENKKDMVFESDLRFYDCYTHPEWIFGLELPCAMLSQPYVVDNTTTIRMAFEPASVDRHFVSNNGILMWRVENYNKKKREDTFYYNILSSTFYTSPRGYRVRIRLVINYTKPLETEIIFLTGEHDASLSTHFPHKTTVTLFNQTDSWKNLVNSLYRDDVSSYSIQLESGRWIEENGFTKDDSLLLNIAIEPVAS